MAIITIESAKDIARVVEQPAITEFTAIHLSGPAISLKCQPQGFSTLFQAIIGQQFWVASAAAIWIRLEKAGLTTQSKVMHDATPKQLAQLGPSRPKICYGHALAASTLDYDELAHLPDEVVLSALTQITGIGRWTTEVYALQALGRADVLPYEDLALQEATRLAFNLPGHPG
mgnify:FL=1